MVEKEPPLSPILDYDNVPGKHKPRPLLSTLATTTTHADTTNDADERTRLLQDVSRSPPLPKRPRNPVGLDSEEFSFEKRRSIPSNVRTCITVCIIVLWLLAAIVIVVLLYFAITGKFDRNNNTQKRDQRTVDSSLPFSDADSVTYTTFYTTILTTRLSANASLTSHGIRIMQQWPKTASGFLLNCTANAPGVYASWSWNQQSTDLVTGSAHNCATVVDRLTKVDCGSSEKSVDVLASSAIVDSGFLTISFCAEDAPSQVSYSLTVYGDSNSILAEYEFSNYSRSPAMSICLGGVAIIFLMMYLSVSLLQARIS